MSSSRLLAIAVCAVVVGFVGLWWIIESSRLQFGAFDKASVSTAVTALYGYMVTVVGVLIGGLYRELQRRKAVGQRTIGSVRGLLRASFSSIDSWLSLAGSPIVYALLWRSLEGGSISALTVMAVQNGFCCTVLIEAFLAQKEKMAPAERIPEE